MFIFHSRIVCVDSLDQCNCCDLVSVIEHFLYL